MIDNNTKGFWDEMTERAKVFGRERQNDMEDYLDLVQTSIKSALKDVEMSRKTFQDIERVLDEYQDKNNKKKDELIKRLREVLA